jgi:hypothetical protein
LVEQRIRNAKVVGSTPIIGTIRKSKPIPVSPKNPFNSCSLSIFYPYIIAAVFSPFLNSHYQPDSTEIKQQVGA